MYGNTWKSVNKIFGNARGGNRLAGTKISQYRFESESSHKSGFKTFFLFFRKIPKQSLSFVGI